METASRPTSEPRSSSQHSCGSSTVIPNRSVVAWRLSLASFALLSAAGRTTIAGHGAWWATCWPTEPSSSSLKPPRPAGTDDDQLGTGRRRRRSPGPASLRTTVWATGWSSARRVDSRRAASASSLAGRAARRRRRHRAGARRSSTRGRPRARRPAGGPPRPPTGQRPAGRGEPSTPTTTRRGQHRPAGVADDGDRHVGVVDDLLADGADDEALHAGGAPGADDERGRRRPRPRGGPTPGRASIVRQVDEVDVVGDGAIDEARAARRSARRSASAQLLVPALSRDRWSRPPQHRRP